MRYTGLDLVYVCIIMWRKDRNLSSDNEQTKEGLFGWRHRSKKETRDIFLHVISLHLNNPLEEGLMGILYVRFLTAM